MLLIAALMLVIVNLVCQVLAICIKEKKKQLRMISGIIAMSAGILLTTVEGENIVLIAAILAYIIAIFQFALVRFSNY
ncbi:MAG: hypothetical protein FWF46_03860 [Oscillospiraceae bacterium]|nr:hypothetical protein [Oscillospiraceae bacterium]